MHGQLLIFHLYRYKENEKKKLYNELFIAVQETNSLQIKIKPMQILWGNWKEGVQEGKKNQGF